MHINAEWNDSKVEQWVSNWNTYIAATRSPTFHVYAAFDGESPVGFVISGKNYLQHPNFERGHLVALYVDAKYQSRSVGKQLICSAISHCERFVSNRMSVTVLSKDEKVRKWYEYFGATYVSSGVTLDETKAEVDYLSFKNLRNLLIEKFDVELQRKTMRDSVRRLFA